MRATYRHHLGRFAVAALLAAVVMAGPAAAIGVGETAPNFTLTDFEGSSASLSSYSSHPVLLVFLECDGQTSIALAPRIQDDIQSRFASQGLVILGIDTRGCTADALRGFKYQTGVTFSLLMNGSSVMSQYGVAEDSFVLIDGNGTVKYVSEGPGIGSYDPSALETAIDNALRDAANTKAMTWGVIKNMYK